MRSLFKDKNDNLLEIESTEADHVYKTPTKEGTNPNESLSTPPLTPFSEQDSPVRSRAISSDNDNSSSVTDGSTTDMASTLANMGMEGTKLLQQVLGLAEEYGGTCGILEDISSFGLKAIPEEKSVDANTNYWGIPPTMDTGNDDDDEYSFEDAHEDFELVLQDKFETDEPLFCKPCAGIIPIESSNFKDAKRKNFWRRKSKSESSAASNPSHKMSTLNLKSFRLFHHKAKKDKRRKKGAVKSPPDRKGKWKAASCPKTKRVYYYHSNTKEVTWERPKSFVEWKVIKNDNKILFFNVITKESTSTMPVGFRLWREAVDTSSNQGKKYYYNILTKETTWNKPKEMADFEEENYEGEVENEKVEKSLQDLVLGEEDEGEKQRSMISKAVESQPYLTADILQNTSSSCSDNISGATNEHEAQSDGQTRLMSILKKYCNDEMDLQRDLIRFCKGNEAAIIKGIDSIIESTPYDEIKATVISYVKSTVETMRNMPMDELSMTAKKVTAFKLPPEVESSKEMNRVNTYSSAYSITSRVMSHTTTKSAMTNVTDATNRVNNKSGQMCNQSTFNAIQEDSFDDHSDTGTEDIHANSSRAELDFKAVLGDDGLSKKAEILDNKRKEDNEFQVKLDMKVEQVKKIVSASSDPERKSFDVAPSSKRSPTGALESHYDADFENHSDIASWSDHGDDVSELSDSFSPAKSKRSAKEKKFAADKARSTNKVVQDIHQVVHQSKSVGSKKLKPKVESLPVSQYVSMVRSIPHDSMEYVELPRIIRKSTKDGDSLSSWEDTITTADSK